MPTRLKTEFSASDIMVLYYFLILVFASMWDSEGGRMSYIITFQGNLLVQPMSVTDMKSLLM